MEEAGITYCSICGIGIGFNRGDQIYKCRGCGKEVCPQCYSPDYFSCNICGRDFDRILEDYEKWSDTLMLETFGLVSLGSGERSLPGTIRLYNGYVSILPEYSAEPMKINYINIERHTIVNSPNKTEYHITFTRKQRLYRVVLMKDQTEVLYLMQEKIASAISRLYWIGSILTLMA